MSVISLMPLLRSREQERAKNAKSTMKEKQRLCDMQRSLHDAIVASTDPVVVNLCAQKLGLAYKGEIALGAPDELIVLYDYTLYEHRVGGQTPIERFAKASPPAEGSDQAMLLNAMLAAKYSIYEITRVEPLLGVEVRDIIRETTLFLVDYGFSISATPDMWFAGHTVVLPQLNMTTGAFLPADDSVVQEALRRRAKFAAAAGGTLKDLTREQQTELATTVTRMALRNGAGEMIAYI